jgi:hypothetical protein
VFHNFEPRLENSVKQSSVNQGADIFGCQATGIATIAHEYWWTHVKGVVTFYT